MPEDARAAKTGDMITMHFTLFSPDGTEIDSSKSAEPLQVQLGAGTILPALENAMAGMVEGESKRIDLPATDAFGHRQDDLVHDIPRQGLDPELDVTPGQRLQGKGPQGNSFVCTIVSSDDDIVTVDANHPLAGLDVVFEVELLSIN